MTGKTIATATATDYRNAITSYARQGYTTVHSTATSTTLSRKKPFNWVLAIICLFIPIIGWIALIFMIMASGRGSDVVELTFDPESAPTTTMRA